jgi:hypothetical protein
MEADSPHRQWLGMAVVCAITMAAGIARSRLAQEAIAPDAGHPVSGKRDEGRDGAPHPAPPHDVDTQ